MGQGGHLVLAQWTGSPADCFEQGHDGVGLEFWRQGLRGCRWAGCVGTLLRGLHSRPGGRCWPLGLGSGLGGGCRAAGGGRRGCLGGGGTQGPQASSPRAEVHMWCPLSNPSLTLGSQSAIRPRCQGLRHPSEACVLSIPVRMLYLWMDLLAAPHNHLSCHLHHQEPDARLVLGQPLLVLGLPEKLAFPGPFPVPRCTCHLWGGLLSRDQVGSSV